MTNVQVRLLAAAIAMLAGAVAASTDNLDINVGITIIFVSESFSSLNISVARDRAGGIGCLSS